MSDFSLTDQERTAFAQEITRNRALDYFYGLDNVPQQFVYRDKLIPGELTDLESRNKAVSETLWLDAYHQHLVCNVGYRFFYQQSVLQMAFQVHQYGVGAFSPPAEADRKFLPTVEDVQANFDGWMARTGWEMAGKLRRQPPGRGGWWHLLHVPDRTVRIASMVPVGNQVFLELISTWTEDGILKETAWAVAAIYDVDGTVLQDRSYIDLSNWPAAARHSPITSTSPQSRPQHTGVMDRFYTYHRSKELPVTLTELETRNLSIVEGPWLDAQNAGLDDSPDGRLFHHERFRMQWPVQKCSCNLDIAREVETIVVDAVPDKTMRLGLAYSKGNQVVVEGIVSWTERGGARESPFISFLLLDQDGRVIRDRRYITLGNWPGADRMAVRLGL